MKDEKVTGFRIFFSWTLFLILLTSVIGYNGLYGQDSYEYLRYCTHLFDFLKNDVAPGNYYWTVNYPLLGAFLAYITGPAIALQLLSILSASWIVYLVCMFLFREFPGRELEVIFYVLLLLGASPYFFRYTISSMSDMMAISFACTAYYALYCGYKESHNRWLYATWFLAAMAVFTRFAMLPLLVPVILFSTFCVIKKFNLIFFIVAIAAALIPAGVHFFFKQNSYADIFQVYPMTGWSVSNYFKSSFTTVEGNLNYTLPNIIFVFSFLVHPGFLFPGILFLFLMFKKGTRPSLVYPVVSAGILLYLFFIAGMPSRNTRYLIPVLPFFIASCFPVYLIILSWLYKRENFRKVFFITMCVVQFLFTVMAFKPFYEYNKLEKFIANKIIEYHPSVLYTFGIDGAIRSYGYRGTIINLWSNPLDTVQQGALLLFNKQQNDKQWKGKNPMLNYNLIVEKAGAVKIETLESGWEIYEIKKAYPGTDSRLPEVRD